jgi:hypothetical protein
MTGFSACKGGDSAPGLRDWVATTERMLGLRPMPPEPEPQTLAFLITDIEGSTRYVGAGSATDERGSGAPRRDPARRSGKLERAQGKRDAQRGKELLSATYATFSEGFTTPDLVDAATLLENVPHDGPGDRR